MRIVVDATAAVRQQAGVGRFARGILHGLAAIDAHNDYVLLTTGKARVTLPQSALPACHSWFHAPIPERVARIAWQRLHIGPPPTTFVRKPDLFFTPDFALPPTGRVPAVPTVHDLSFLVHPECADEGLRRYLSRAVPHSVRRAAAVVAVSDTTAQALQDLLGVAAEAITVVPNGVDALFRPSSLPKDVLASELRERFALEPGYLLTVGTLEPRKNYVRLLQAFDVLRTRLARSRSRPDSARAGDLRLVIAGREGWLYEPIFREIARLGLHGAVRFFACATDDDLLTLYHGASAFVFPSLYEGFGIPPLEAMACGIPVASSSGGALKEVLDDAALFFDPFDVDAISNALQTVAEDEVLRERLVQRGYARAAGYTWEHAARNLLRAFEGIAS